MSQLFLDGVYTTTPWGKSRFHRNNAPDRQGEAKLIASIEDQVVIDKILDHLQAKGSLPPTPELLPATRASPTSDWFV